MTQTKKKPEPRLIKWYGWRPDLPDARDHIFRPRSLAKKLTTVRLKDKFSMPKVVDQGNLGSCTGNGIGGIIMFNILNKHITNPLAEPFDFPSRLHIYYFERYLEKTINEDAGAEIRDGIKAVAKWGVPAENLWPYDISKFTNKPNPAALKDALQFKALEYQRVDNTSKASIVAALNMGYPVVDGFTVYESFESDAVAKTGKVPMPGKSENVLGGHCTYIVGYDAQADRFEKVNSWGTNWGVSGNFSMPAKYLTNSNMADDFWIIKTTL